MKVCESFGFTPSNWDKPLRVELDDNEPRLIDGVEILDTICPVSKLTGHRTNPLTLLGAVTDGNSRLLQAVLAELPAVQTDPSVTDEDKLDLLVSRLDTGTFADMDAVRDALASISDSLFVKPEVQEQAEKQVISFEENKPSVSDEE
jgi:hypothetical protein